MSNLILTEQRGNIFEIILNRPEKKNAINLGMMDALDEAVRQANRLPAVRVVLLRSSDKTFSAGIDPEQLKTLADTYGPDWKQRSRAATYDAQAVFNRLERLELPVIALIDGFCLGMGMELALACDLRVATERAVLGLPEARLGLIPDVGGTTRLSLLAGPARAKELIFTGRRIRAREAEAWGIVNTVVPNDDLLVYGEKLAAEITQSAPLAVGLAKRVIDSLHDTDRGLTLEALAQGLLFKTEDFDEGLDSFLRRPADFKGR